MCVQMDDGLQKMDCGNRAGSRYHGKLAHLEAQLPPSFLALPVCSQHAACFTVALSSWGRWVGAVVSSHPICAPANSGLANQSYTCVSVLRKDYCSFAGGCWIGVWDGIVEQWVEFNPVSTCWGGTLCTRVGGQWHLHGTDCGNRAGIVSSPTSY